MSSSVKENNRFERLTEIIETLNNYSNWNLREEFLLEGICDTCCNDSTTVL